MNLYKDLDAVQIVSLLIEKSNKERGYVAKLSRKTGIPYDRIAQWINGRGKPKADDVNKLKGEFVELQEIGDPVVEYHPQSAPERIRELEKDKEVLRDSISSSLSVIQSSQDIVLKVLHMVLEQTVEIKAAVLGKTVLEVAKEVNKTVNSGLQYGETDKKNAPGSSHRAKKN